MDMDPLGNKSPDAATTQVYLGSGGQEQLYHWSTPVLLRSRSRVYPKLPGPL